MQRDDDNRILEANNIETDPWRQKHHPFIQATLNFLWEMLPQLPSQILDLGAGDGYMVAQLLSK
jgi:hypothetical protein